MDINRERLIQTFLTLVQIDSESGEEQEIIAYLKKEMDDLGFKTDIDKIGNLICSNDPNPKLMLAAHTDTVKPGKGIKPIIEGNIIKTDGTTILGADNKSGVSAILEILTSIKENGLKVELEVVFTVKEEIGPIGSSNLDFTKLKAKQSINLDSKPGDIVSNEPSLMHFDIEITGKAAHSGTRPENGINAIQIAAKAISKLKLGRIDFETTSNVGLINGGMARNIIPEKVTLEAEVRSRNDKKFEFYTKKLIETFKETALKYGGTIDIQANLRGKAYKHQETDPMVKLLVECGRQNGIKYNFTSTGGLTDANIFNRHGIKCITTGASGNDYHTTREYLEIDKFVIGTKIILDAIIELTK